jgi:ankyrin repeat protein
MYGTHVDAAAKDGSTPLLFALRRGQYDVARLLMQMKADVNRRARGVSDGLSSQELREPADAQFSAMMYPTTALLIATKAGEHAIMKELLDRGAGINAGNEHGVTALMVAAAKNDATAIRMLRDYGANLEATAAGGFRALSIAVWYKAASALSLLLELGASVKSELADRQHPLHLAARHGSREVVSVLLQALSEHADDLAEDVDIRDVHGLTPLLLACSERRIDILRMLLEHNANVNVASRNGLRCAMLFLSNKVKKPIGSTESEELISLLLQHGADLDAKSSADMSAVLMAVQGQHDAYAAALIRAGVDTMTTTKDGFSLSRLAADNKLPLTLDALRTRQQAV